MVKYLKKSFLTIFTLTLLHNLITKKQCGFRPGDSTTNQLIGLVNEIHHAFDSNKSLEVSAIFLDISKAFDKVWHDGQIFKTRQNGISIPKLNYRIPYEVLPGSVPNIPNIVRVGCQIWLP